MNACCCRSESGSTVSRPEEIAERSKDILANGGSVYCSWTDTVPSSGSEQSVVSASSVDPTAKAASVVCHMLVLNAWRRRRAEITQLEQQVEHLHLQIEFLRRLLIAENERVGRLNGELHREKSQLEEVTRERDAVRLVRRGDRFVATRVLFPDNAQVRNNIINIQQIIRNLTSINKMQKSLNNIVQTLCA